MINNKILDFKDTLKETSLNSANGDKQYITNSLLEVINFDRVKDEYIKDLGLSEVPNSNDALFIKNSSYYFIEFKAGEIDTVKNLQIKLKIYDSLLILLDIIKQNISFSRSNMIYILVYNDSKDHTSKLFRKGSKRFIQDYVSKKGKKEFICFDLERFQNLYFKEVHTYTYEEFENNFVAKFE